MMKNIKYLVGIILLSIFPGSCGKDEHIDKEKPSIVLNMEDAFPLNCDTLYFGEVFELKVLFSDNAQLGSFSIDIHHNFDHHSHSTEMSSCSFSPVKAPVNPFTLIRDYSIPGDSKEYRTNLPIDVPYGNTNGLFDEGDYHLFISLTDKEGWSAQKGLSIKMLRR